MMQIKYRRELVELMKHLNLPLIGAEIGTAEGRFSEELLDFGMEKLYSVDAWQTLNQKGDGGFPQEWHDENYRKAKELLKPYGNRSIILKGLSHEMANEIPNDYLSLAYFDAAHDYGSVMRDLIHWIWKVRHGGIIATHDYLNDYGAKEAFEEYCKGQDYEIHLLPEDKEEDAGAYFIKK